MDIMECIKLGRTINRDKGSKRALKIKKNLIVLVHFQKQKNH